MEITLKNTEIENNEISDKVKAAFPDLKVSVPPLNKKITVVQKNNWVMSRVIRKKDKLVVKGEPNTQSTVAMGLIILGVLAGLIGAVIVIGLMYALKGKEAKAFGEEVYNKLKDQF